MTMSGCTVRFPCLTVASKSVDRVMRLRAESTAVTPESRIRQSVNDGPCHADSTRSPGRPWSASSAENRAHGHGAGYSAGRSACPLPRFSPCCIWHRARHGFPCRWVTLSPRCLDRPCVSLVTGAASALDARIAAVSPTFGRLYEGTDRRSPGQTAPKRRPVRRQSLTAVTSATARASNLCQAVPNVAERLARAGKTVSFGRCCFIPKRCETTSKDGRSAFQPAEFHWPSRVPIPRAVRGMLRHGGRCPFHTCG